MRPRIDEWYEDRGLGNLKFRGYDDGGNYLFSSYTRFGDSFSISDNSVRLNPGDFNLRLKQGHMAKTYPPI